MKLLFFQWHSFMNKGITRALEQLGIPFDVFFYQFQDWEEDAAFCEKFDKELQKGVYERVLSVNFSPLISDLCERHGIPYVSWVYDAPLHIRDQRPLKNTCNTIWFFDRMQAEDYKQQGILAKHLPLAVDPLSFAADASEREQHKYCVQVSLVGNLYQTEYAYYSAPLNDYQRGYMEGIIQAQSKLYGGYIIPEMLTDELMEDLNVSYRRASGRRFEMGKRELEFMLACETTGRERYLALALLSGHFQVAYYSGKEDERLKKASYRGYADYYSQMPLIFKNSSVNLNISLKAIRTGIPLRVLDVMGCGGFLMTNYQEEIAEHFEDGTDLAVYDGIEDLYAKTAFYLNHEDARRRIAERGLQKVLREFRFEDRIKMMLAGSKSVK